jgi:hypothetical protein
MLTVPSKLYTTRHTIGLFLEMSQLPVQTSVVYGTANHTSVSFQRTLSKGLIQLPAVCGIYAYLYHLVATVKRNFMDVEITQQT